MSRTTRRSAIALTSALALTLVALPTTQSVASDPESSALTVPSEPDMTVSASYTGAAPPSAFLVTGCPTGPPGSDEHDLEVTVPEGVYDRLQANLSVKITWDNPDNDLILVLLNEAGEAITTSDGGSPEEIVTLDNPEATTYTARVCGFISGPQPYEGTVSIQTSRPTVLPTIDTGLEFSPSLVTDPQRSQGESAAFTDGQGVLYSCGTNGASNGTDHGSVSVDGGETWRPLGTGPVGETGTVQGGGDCAIGTGQDPNEDGNRQLAFIGLGPLTGFSTFTSPDNGRTLQRSPSQNGLLAVNQRSLVDRQWLTFTDDKTVILNYNAALSSAVPGNVFNEGQVVQISEDGGLTYGPQIQAANDGSRLGQIRTINDGTIPGVDDDIVYFPYNSGTLVKLALSKDGGQTWSQCVAVDAEIDPTAGFVAADHDRAGNIYVTYTEKGGGRDTYLVSLRAADVPKCEGPAPASESAENNTNPGFTPKVRINREGIETTVMPWVAAGGAPGRVAVSYYGTPSVGNPDSAQFKATWNVYVGQTLDAFASTPQIDQVKATTHPNHYDSICLNGLQCTIDGSDRSLVDYFTMSYDPKGDRLLVVYNQASKRPDDAAGRIAQPVALVQRAGPTNGGEAQQVVGPEVLRTNTSDRPEDAFPRWTTGDGLFGSPVVRQPGGANQPALDLLDVQVGPEVDLETGELIPDGGFTVTMKYADLSPGALNGALTGGVGTSLVYLFRFFDGFESGGAMAYFEPLRGGWRFGSTDYETTEANPQGRVQTYEPEDEIVGAVDEEAGTIRLSVPRDQLEALEGDTGPGERPTEVQAVTGSRIYDASAWTFVNNLPINDEQSFLMQADNTAAFDFALPAATQQGGIGGGTTIIDLGPGDGTGSDGTGSDGTGGTATNGRGGSLAATGGLGVPLLALVAMVGAGAAWRRHSRRA